MTNSLNSQNLLTALKPYNVESHKICFGNSWTISINLAHEDFVWLGTAIAVSRNADDAELKVLRYGPTAEEALNNAVCMMKETITAFEGRRSEQKEWSATFQAGTLDF